MYRPSSGDCSRAIPCVNGPAKGVYTGAGTPAGVCPYECVGGYGGSQCTPCASSGFVESRHIYLKGTACEYSCKPYVYRDTALQCNQPCLDLADRVLSRVSEYTRLGWTLKSYELGRCGTNDAIPTSDIPFLRKGRWGVLTLTKSCGNALLELGEKCDDGNAVSGDGCSSTCQIETDANYWDCDVIGAACVRMCGWSTQASDSWGIGLRGFLLPSCPGGICSCLNKSYHEVLQEKAGDRRRWMFDRFSPCNCGGNLQRTVSYEVRKQL
jgi:cysteine-rich repeat protein